MKFSEFFERAYVINLPKRVDRRHEIAKELQKAGMPLQVGKVELFSAIQPKEAFPFKSIGAKGCFLSHLEILKEAQAQGLRNVLIVEDDLEFAPEFKQHEAYLLEQLMSKDWSFVQFGYCGHGDEPNYGKSLPILRSFSGEKIGSHCYAVNGKSIQMLIDFLEALLVGPVGDRLYGPMSLDGALNVFKWQHPEINRLIAIPSVANQRSSASDVSPSWFDQVPVMNQAVALARKVVSPQTKQRARMLCTMQGWQTLKQKIKRKVAAPLRARHQLFPETLWDKG
ncbi:MAG: glycosyltransferase family 25 protein [Spirulina sp. SIO3F2]|nr:glycosyltransferase family 25 protein [Spirulina sp. SIO3F2]